MDYSWNIQDDTVWTVCVGWINTEWTVISEHTQMFTGWFHTRGLLFYVHILWFLITVTIFMPFFSCSEIFTLWPDAETRHMNTSAKPCCCCCCYDRCTTADETKQYSGSCVSSPHPHPLASSISWPLTINCLLQPTSETSPHTVEPLRSL